MAHSHEHDQHGDPEPTEDGGQASKNEQEHPYQSDHDLDGEQDQLEAEDCALLSACQPGGNGGLVWITHARAVLNCAPDPGLSGVIEVALEGKPPLGVASLLNPVVHRVVRASLLLARRREAGRRLPRASLASHRGWRGRLR